MRVRVRARRHCAQVGEGGGHPTMTIYPEPPRADLGSALESACKCAHAFTGIPDNDDEAAKEGDHGAVEARLEQRPARVL